MDAAALTSWDIFSSSVRRETRSLALLVMANVGLQNGYDLVDGFDESQENGGGEDD